MEHLCLEVDLGRQKGIAIAQLDAQLEHATLVWGTLRAGYSCLEMVVVSLIDLVEKNAWHWVLIKILQLFLDPCDTLLVLIAHRFCFFSMTARLCLYTRENEHTRQTKIRTSNLLAY